MRSELSVEGLAVGVNSKLKMDEPVLKQVNQIGITYIEGERRDFHYEIIFERILRIPEGQIDGIDGRGLQDSYLKWHPMSSMKQYVNSLLGGIYQLVMIVSSRLMTYPPMVLG